VKVLFFCNLVPDKPGAFERLLAEIGRQCGAGGDALVVVAAGAPHPTVAAWFREARVRWHRVEGWTDERGRVRPWRFCRPALRLVRAERPDVAVVHFGNELPSWLVSVAGPRVVKWVWQQDQQIAPATVLTRRLSRLRLLAQRFDHFVAVYAGGARSLLERGIAAERMTVIPNGVAEPVRQRPPGWLRAALDLPVGSVLALSVNALIPRKRVDLQVLALARLPSGGPVVHLAVVGDGPERDALGALAQAQGVERRVHFLGRRDDVTELLLEADVLLLTSRAEGSAYVLAEAMAAGIPAIATDAGAAREQIADGVSGRVVPGDDVAAVAGALSALVGDAELRRRMGEAARARWQSRYRVEQSAAAYVALYRRLARGG